MKRIVFLRAVNLGARNKVPMAQLRSLLEGAGYEDVRTHLASGNVLLDASGGAAALAREIERLIADTFDVTTTAIIRTPTQLAATVAGHPFGKDTSETHVAFLARKPEKSATARFRTEHGDPARTVLKGSDVYLRLSRGVQGTHLSVAKLESLLGEPATLRNWRTVSALAEG